MIAAAGFKFVRMDLSWSATEKKKGEYDWSAHDELTANLEKRGLRALYILAGSNALYEQESATFPNPWSVGRKGVLKRPFAPQHPESVEAFARWASAAAKHFRGRHIIWEIWNEPNGDIFWPPKADVNQYITLALATAKAVRAADPEATIIAPGSARFPWDYLETMFASGILEYLDAVSVHPYRWGYWLPKLPDVVGPPETVTADYARLRGLIAKYAPAGKQNLPIISGEWGYPTHDGGVSLETQAAFIVRQQLVNLLDGVPLSIWYDWNDDGPDPANPEHHFGTCTRDLKPKPAYLAVQTMTRELSGYRIFRLLKTGRKDACVLLCVNNAGTKKLVAWTVGEPQTITVELEGRRFSLDLVAMPQYVAVNPPKQR